MSIQSIKTELLDHLKQRVIDEAINEDNYEDAHHHAFNEDYYIVGYYQAEQWLESHNMSAFEAIQMCIDYERENFGEVSKDYDNAETTVNMLTYVIGQEVTPYADNYEEFLNLLDLEIKPDSCIGYEKSEYDNLCKHCNSNKYVHGDSVVHV